MNVKVAPLLAAVLLGPWLAVSSLAAAEIPAAIAAAVSDPHRPAADTARDAARKPGEVLAFAGLKPGDKVFELLPGGGFYTRILSVSVGPGGHVYTYGPTKNFRTGQPQDPNPLAGDGAYANVSGVGLDATAPAAAPEPVDLVFTAENYHDLHLSRFNLDIAAFDKQLFAMLKPGGVLIIEDHAAVDGTGLTKDADGKIVPDKLHRIDEAVVKREAAAAGFVLVGESDILRNPADPRTALVFDPSIRGHTDQFLLKFRKPG